MMQTDWPLYTYAVYRGLGWHKPLWAPTTVNVIARGACGLRWFRVWMFTRPVLSVKAAKEQWRDVFRIVTERHPGLCQSVDGLPWEIHGIDNELAYAEACTQWQLAQLLEHPIPRQ